MLTKPWTAFVTVPSVVRRSAGTAKNARKTSELPSSRYRAPWSEAVTASPSPDAGASVSGGEGAVQDLAGNLLHADPAVHCSPLDEREGVELGEVVAVHQDCLCTV